MKKKYFKYTNKLIHSTSPYLLQHAHNPVNWYPWGEEAFNKAKSENKLIIISIGYAACHWCHVMEKESFENEEVAKFMNEYFVSIKVDREERPDIDQIYMNAVQLISGSGGWPLNCIALPDGRPFFGGTYFSTDHWFDVLKKVNDYVAENPEQAENQTALLTEGVQSNEIMNLNHKIGAYNTDDLNRIFSNWQESLDKEFGGYIGAPKFPLPVSFQFLKHYFAITKNPEAMKAVTLTLNKMASGGIYDQVGGGFARYSTDAEWKVPHFEKMLYDNAQLVSLYSNAYQLTKDNEYKNVVIETLNFVQREMSADEGGFFSSLDADSEGEEGKFYVWDHAEILNVLQEHANIISDYYNISVYGNWEDSKNILFRTKEKQVIAEKYGIPEAKLSTIIQEAKNTLLHKRSERIPPSLDDKIITSWNALMLSAYIDAYRILDDSTLLGIALNSADFINSTMKLHDNRLNRIYKNGKATINGFLDDYAFTIKAFISLYQVTFDEEWINTARQLTEYVIEHFHDAESGFFYYTSDIDPTLIARKIEIHDNVIPSSNAEMAKNLFILGHYFYDDNFIDQSKQMLNAVYEDAILNGRYYANWDILMAWFVSPPYEIAIVGDDFETMRKKFDKQYLPNIFLAGGKQEGTLPLLKDRVVANETIIYVCRNKACKLPVNSVEKALQQIEQ